MEVSFSRGETLKSVRIEDDGLGFHFILFYFPFIFSYFLRKK